MYYYDVVRNMSPGTLDDKATVVWDFAKVVAEHFERFCFLRRSKGACD